MPTTYADITRADNGEARVFLYDANGNFTEGYQLPAEALHELLRTAPVSAVFRRGDFHPFPNPTVVPRRSATGGDYWAEVPQL